MPRRPRGATPQRSIRVPDEVWAAALAEAERRDETVTEAIVRFLVEDYTASTRARRTAEPDDVPAGVLIDDQAVVTGPGVGQNP